MIDVVKGHLMYITSWICDFEFRKKNANVIDKSCINKYRTQLLQKWPIVEEIFLIKIQT